MVSPISLSTYSPALNARLGRFAVLNPVRMASVKSKLLHFTGFIPAALSVPLQIVEKFTPYWSLRNKDYVLRQLDEGKLDPSYVNKMFIGDAAVTLAMLRRDNFDPKWLTPSLMKDKDFLSEAVNISGWVLDYTSPTMLKNENLILSALRSGGFDFSKADKSLRGNKNFVLEALKIDGKCLEFVSGDLKRDRDVVLAAIRASNSCDGVLQFADKAFRSDEQLVLEAVKRNWGELQWIDPSLFSNRDIAMEAVKQNGRALEYAPYFLNDREMVLEAVSKCGLALEYADPSLRCDDVIVGAALKNDPWALKYADKSFQKNPVIVMDAIERNGHVLQFAHTDYQFRKEYVLAALRSHEFAYASVPRAMFKDRDILLEAAKGSGKVLDDLWDDQKHFLTDPEIILAAIKTWPKAAKLADKKLIEDRDFMLQAVKANGEVMASLDEVTAKKYGSDRELILEAVKTFPLALKYADFDIKRSIEVVTCAVTKNPVAIKYAGQVFNYKLEFLQKFFNIDDELITHCKELDIEYLARFMFSGDDWKFQGDTVLKEVISNRLNLGNKNDMRPRAVLIYNKDDWNNAYLKNQIASLMKRGYRVDYFEVSTVSGLCDAVSSATINIGRQADILVLAGHGMNKGKNKGIWFGKEHLRFDGNSQFSKLSKCLKNNGRVILESCLSGFGGRWSSNMANYMKKVFKSRNAVVFSETVPTNVRSYVYDSDDVVISVVHGNKEALYTAK